jgi:hypothetical protein
VSEDPKPKPTITARAILAALAEIKRRGRWPLFQQLESQEPELTEHVLEELSLVHQTLMASGASRKADLGTGGERDDAVFVDVKMQITRRQIDASGSKHLSRLSILHQQ